MTAHLAVCKDCSAPVRWVKMRESGKSMPVNPVALSAPGGHHGLVTNPAARTTVGNVACTLLGNRATDGHVISSTEPACPTEHVYRAHWADCPRGQAKKPRSKAAEQPALFTEGS